VGNAGRRKHGFRRNARGRTPSWVSDRDVTRDAVDLKVLGEVSEWALREEESTAFAAMREAGRRAG